MAPAPGTAAVVIAATCGACVPYAYPPVTGAVGVRRTTAADARTGIHAEVGFAPFQLASTELHRAWDATLSATFDHAGGNAWGTAIAAGPILHPWGDLARSRATTRVMPQLVGRLTSEMHAAAVRVIVEYAAFTDSAGETDDGFTAMYGEAAIGGYLEAGRQWANTGDGWAITVGMTFRIPAIAGIACCIFPK
jgi:hypothetical protein